MKVSCIEGHWHDVTPTGLAIVVQAFIEGDMQRIGHEGVIPLCLREAFTDVRVKDFEQRYVGNHIRIDRERKPSET